MKLKHEKKTKICVEYTDLENLICEIYSVSNNYYDFVSDTEGRNNSIQEFKVKKGALDIFDRNELRKWKNGEGGDMMTQAILEELCDQEIIDEGDYSINIFW